MKASGLDGGGISVRTIRTLLKAFIRYRCERSTAYIAELDTQERLSGQSWMSNQQMPAIKRHWDGCR